MKCFLCYKELERSAASIRIHEKYICRECCGIVEKAELLRSGNTKKVPLYLYIEDGRYIVSNWCGSLKWEVLRVRRGHHNIAGTREDVWFTIDGYSWHGVCYGENTELLHAKRTKHKLFA